LAAGSLGVFFLFFLSYLAFSLNFHSSALAASSAALASSIFWTLSYSSLILCSSCFFFFSSSSFLFFSSNSYWSLSSSFYFFNYSFSALIWALLFGTVSNIDAISIFYSFETLDFFNFSAASFSIWIFYSSSSFYLANSSALFSSSS